MYPEILTIGPITLYSFGAMMGIGFLVAANLTGRELHRKGLDPDIASSLLFATAIGGIAGSRAWAIFNDWSLLTNAPLQALLGGAGFVWYGGLIGGAVAATLVFWRHGIPWLRGADCVAPGLVLGQAIGRLGCHLAGDGDWGAVTEVPWGVAYREAIIGWPHPEGVLVHPTPLYEAAAYTVSFALMWAARRRLPADGSVFALYLLSAPAARFVIEFYRINPPVFAGLTQAQLFSIGLVGAGALLLAAVARQRQSAPFEPGATRPAGIEAAPETPPGAAATPR
jgi:phosphatidylglycerol---prolipoprotein diacylglyceryl transferase